MFKKLLQGVGITFLGLIIIIVVMAIWSSIKYSNSKETAVPYLNTALTEISSWDVNVFRQYVTEGVLEGVTEEELTKLFRAFSKMGELKEFGDFEVTNFSSKALVGSGSGTFVTYVVPVQYENGDAIITVTLKEDQDSFSVYNFKLNSMTLIE